MGINLAGPINVDQFQNIINQGFLDWRKLLGPEKVTNPNFTGNATGWTLNTGWTYSSNAVNRDGTGTATMSQDVSAVVGEIYRVEYEITAYTDGSVTVSVGGESGTARSSAAVFVEYIKASTTGVLGFTPTADSTFTIDNVSCKKVGYVAADGIAAWIEDRGATAGKGALHLMTEDGTKHVFGDRVGLGTLYPTVGFDVELAARFGSTVTFAGAVAGGDQSWTNVGDMTFATGSIIASGSTNGNTLILRANDTAFITFTTGATDVCTLDGPTIQGTVLAGTGLTMPFFTPNGEVFAALCKASRNLNLPVNAGWTTALGTGASVSQAPDNMQISHGTTASQSALARCTLRGWRPNDANFGYIDWDKKLYLTFFLGVDISETGQVFRLQLKEATTEGVLAAKGIGIQVDNLAISGESYGTGLATVNLSTSLTVPQPMQITIIHYPGSKIEWYVENVLKGTQSTAANIPGGDAGTLDYFVMSSLGSGTPSDTTYFTGHIWLWQEL